MKSGERRVRANRDPKRAPQRKERNALGVVSILDYLIYVSSHCVASNPIPSSHLLNSPTTNQRLSFPLVALQVLLYVKVSWKRFTVWYDSSVTVKCMIVSIV